MTLKRHLYERDGVILSSRKAGEGVVKWIDRQNVIFELNWCRVERVWPRSGRIEIVRFRWEDGWIIRKRSMLTAVQSKLAKRPPQ